MKHRNHQGKEEEESAQPNGEFGQNGGCLRTKEIVRKSTAECRPEPLAFGALHQDRENHQKTNQYEETC